MCSRAGLCLRPQRRSSNENYVEESLAYASGCERRACVSTALQDNIFVTSAAALCDVVAVVMCFLASLRNPIAIKVVGDNTHKIKVCWQSN